jgi:Rrf2 family transcriptional regulator, nitric oxide-sensitive transcriptional repressor
VKLTAFTDYSLRVLILLACKSERRATISEIARTYGISEHHLTKVVHALGKAGWVETVRGKGGGLALAMPPAEIRVGDVVREAEGPAMPAACFGAAGGGCSIAPVCHLQGVLREAVEAFQAVLDRYTLEDLVSNRQALASLLLVERPARERSLERGH